MKSILLLFIISIFFNEHVVAQSSTAPNLSAHMPKACDDKMLTELYNEIGPLLKMKISEEINLKIR